MVIIADDRWVATITQEGSAGPDHTVDLLLDPLSVEEVQRGVLKAEGGVETQNMLVVVVVHLS